MHYNRKPCYTRRPRHLPHHRGHADASQGTQEQVAWQRAAPASCHARLQSHCINASRSTNALPGHYFARDYFSCDYSSSGHYFTKDYFIYDYSTSGHLFIKEYFTYDYSISGFDFTGADCQGWMKEAGFKESRVEHLVGPDFMVVGVK